MRTSPATVSDAPIALFYFANFAALGIALPYLALWLEHRGASASWIGLVAAAPSVVALLTTPLSGIWADRLRDWRSALVVGSWLFVATLAWWLVSLDPIDVLVVWTLCGVLSIAIAPVADAATLALDKRELVSFGRIRAIGSVGYIAAVLLGGRLFDGDGIERFLGALLVLALARAACAHLLPSFREHVPHVPLGTAAVPRTVEPAFLAVLCGAALVNAAHAMYYTFGLLHWQSIGINTTVGARLWTVGIVLEILLMWRFRGIASRWSARHCLVVAALCSVLRWSVTGLDPALPLLVAVQGLHAVTFGLTFLAAVSYIARRGRDEAAARDQALFTTLSGATLALATLAAGALYERVGAAAYQLMTALSVLGLLCLLVSYRLEARGEGTDPA